MPACDSAGMKFLPNGRIWMKYRSLVPVFGSPAWLASVARA